MRALPIIERVLIAVIALGFIALLIALIAWHLRWNSLMRMVAANPPRADVAAACAAVTSRPASTSGDLVAQANNMPGGALALSSFDLDAPWMLGAVEGKPVDAIADLERHRDRLAVMQDLLTRGLCLDGTDDNTWICAVESWVLAARIDPDPRADLKTLDQVKTALTPDSFDERSWINIAEMRDEAYLAAAIRGTIDAARLRPWQDAPDVTIATILLGIEHARLSTTTAAMDDFSHFPYAKLWADGPGEVAIWWRIPQLFGRRCIALSSLEDEFLPACRQPLFISDGTTRAYAQVYRHRLAVLASRIIVQARAEGGVPATCAGDLAPGPRLPALQYQRIDAHRFCISTVPDQDRFLAAWHFSHDPTNAPPIPQDRSSLDAGTVMIVLEPAH